MSLRNSRLFSPALKRLLPWWGAAAFAAFSWMGWSIGAAPVERQLGISQKIFYIHLPSAWCAFGMFALVFAFSGLYLWKRGEIWDALSVSAAELGLLFTTVVLVTGSIWARAAWGAWWTWDVRLTTTLILWFLYAGYFVLRGAFAGHARMPVFAAVFALAAFLDVPLVRVSIQLFKTQHPAVLKRSGGGGLDPEMARTLLVSSLAFAMAAALLWVARSRQEILLRRRAHAALASGHETPETEVL
jgi:heme exporter protein C